jgi:hypothetical protein
MKENEHIETPGDIPAKPETAALLDACELLPVVDRPDVGILRLITPNATHHVAVTRDILLQFADELRSFADDLEKKK